MIHPFEKRYFQKYLHNNCHRNWFSKNPSNSRYKNSSGIFDVIAYGDEYTIQIRELLKDPYFNDNNQAMRYGEVLGGVAAAATPVVTATIVAGPFGFLFAEAALLLTGAGATAGLFGAFAGNLKNDPYDVHFHIVGDNSYWKAEQVPCDGIRNIAHKICEWSNEVYRERYVREKSDDYEFQDFIEQRPSSPHLIS